MISKTWQGYYISKRVRNSEFHHYVKSIYKGEITWTTDYTYAKHYSEKTAKRLDAEIEESLLNGTCNNEFIIADSEVESEPETAKESEDKTMDNKTMNSIMQTIAEYALIAEEAQRIVDENKELLKAYMTEAGIDTLIGDEHKATYKEVVSSRFDSKAFKADGYEDLYKAYQTPSASMRFTFA